MHLLYYERKQDVEETKRRKTKC